MNVALSCHRITSYNVCYTKLLRVHVVGSVPRGLPHLALPRVNLSLELILQLIPTAFAMFIVILAQSAATSRAYAERYNERFSENIDLVGLGLANIGAGLSGTFVVNGSPTVITSYSIHYTKLYDRLFQLVLLQVEAHHGRRGIFIQGQGPHFKGIDGKAVTVGFVTLGRAGAAVAGLAIVGSTLDSYNFV